MKKLNIRIICLMALTIISFLLFKTANASPMVDMMFHEARNQPVLGQQLVYRTVKNRAADSRWKADTVEAVIYQKYQFSYTLLPQSVLNKRVQKEWDSYVYLHQLISDWDSVNLQDPIGFEKVNHYMRCDIVDKIAWDDNMVFLGAVGDHCFFRGY